MKARTVAEWVTAATIGVVSAWALTSMIDDTPPPAPEPTPVSGQLDSGSASPPAEDEPGWNCLTDGNQTCGPDWSPLTAGQLEAITIAHAGFDDWQGCLTDDVTVVCDDGYTYAWEWVAVTDYGLV